MAMPIIFDFLYYVVVATVTVTDVTAEVDHLDDRLLYKCQIEKVCLPLDDM